MRKVKCVGCEDWFEVETFTSAFCSDECRGYAVPKPPRFNPNKCPTPGCNNSKRKSRPICKACARKLKKPKVKKKKYTKSNYRKESNTFLASDEWRALRYRVLTYYGRKCMCCNSTTNEIHVDHIRPRSKYPELKLDFNNLQVLCIECNFGKSNVDQTDFRPRDKTGVTR